MKICLHLIAFFLLFIQNISADNFVFNIVVPNPTNECWIVGNFNNWNIRESQHCIKIDDSHFTVTLNDSSWVNGINLSNLNYKYMKCSCDWMCVEKGIDGEDITVRLYNPGINDTIASWSNYPMTSSAYIYVTTPPETQECYLIGSFFHWEAPNENGKMAKYQVLQNDSVVFRTSIIVSACDDNKYQFCCGPTLEYIQSNPLDTFSLAQTYFPTIKSWKKSIVAKLDITKNEKLKVHTIGQKIIIDGLQGNEEILIFDVAGRIRYKIKASGQSIKEVSVEKGYYILKSGNSVRNIIVG